MKLIPLNKQSKKEQKKYHTRSRRDWNGLKPAVIGLIAAALLSLSGTVFFPQGFSANVFGTAQFYVSLSIFAVAFILAFKKIHPILIILLSAVIGIAVGLIGTD